MVTTRPPKTIVKPTALGSVANTDTKLLIYGLFQKGRVLAQDGDIFVCMPTQAGQSDLLFCGSHRVLAQDGELLPKSDIVKSQFATSLEGGDESANKRRNQAGMVPADRRLIKFGAPG